jgi:hypothetical protein
MFAAIVAALLLSAAADTKIAAGVVFYLFAGYFAVAGRASAASIVIAVKLAITVFSAIWPAAGSVDRHLSEPGLPLELNGAIYPSVECRRLGL